MSWPGGTLSWPGGVFELSGAAAGGVVVVVGGAVVAFGWFCFGPAQGGLPFCTRAACFVAPAFHVMTFRELHLPLFVWVTVVWVATGGVTTGEVTGAVTGWVTGVGTVGAGGGDGV